MYENTPRTHPPTPPEQPANHQPTHACTHVSIHPLTHPDPSIRRFTHSPIPTHPSVHSFTHPLILPPTHQPQSPTHTSTHPSTHTPVTFVTPCVLPCHIHQLQLDLHLRTEKAYMAQRQMDRLRLAFVTDFANIPLRCACWGRWQHEN